MAINKRLLLPIVNQAKLCILEVETTDLLHKVTLKPWMLMTRYNTKHTPGHILVDYNEKTKGTVLSAATQLRSQVTEVLEVWVSRHESWPLRTGEDIRRFQREECKEEAGPHFRCQDSSTHGIKFAATHGIQQDKKLPVHDFDG